MKSTCDFFSLCSWNIYKGINAFCFSSQSMRFLSSPSSFFLIYQFLETVSCSISTKGLIRVGIEKEGWMVIQFSNTHYLYLNVATMNSRVKRYIAFWIIKWYHLLPGTTSWFSPLQEYLHGTWWCILCCLMNWIITIVAWPSWTGPKFSYLYNNANNVSKIWIYTV